MDAPAAPPVGNRQHGREGPRDSGHPGVSLRIGHQTYPVRIHFCSGGPLYAAGGSGSIEDMACPASGRGRHAVADTDLFVGRASALATLAVAPPPRGQAPPAKAGAFARHFRRSRSLQTGERGRSPYENRMNRHQPLRHAEGSSLGVGRVFHVAAVHDYFDCFSVDIL